METVYVPPPTSTSYKKTPPINPTYENFITQAQGHFSDRPIPPRVGEKEAIFINQAIAEIRTLGKKVNTLETESKERDLELIAVFEKLDEGEEETKRLRRICDEVGRCRGR